MNELRDRVALVTGGGSGLGAAICQSLSEAGAIIVAADVRREAADRVIGALPTAAPGSHGCALDVTDAEQAEQTIARIVRDQGRLDILINNAGTDLSVPIEELTPRDWDHILDVNLRGPFILSRLALPIMKKQGSGHIVNITSTAAKRAWANASAYHASKYGLLGFTYALHVEARPHNVKVTAVIPGGMQTPFILDRFPDTPLQNLQDPRNVADTIRFVLTQPAGTVIPEVLVIPMRETSWP